MPHSYLDVHLMLYCVMLCYVPRIQGLDLDTRSSNKHEMVFCAGPGDTTRVPTVLVLYMTLQTLVEASALNLN